MILQAGEGMCSSLVVLGDGSGQIIATSKHMVVMKSKGNVFISEGNRGEGEILFQHLARLDLSTLPFIGV